MSDKKLWEQYVALEKERDALCADLEKERKEHRYTRHAAEAEAKQVDRLRAKIEQMEQQEPECEVVGQIRNVGYEVRTLKYDLPAGTKLYALPGAQPSYLPSDLAEAIIEDLQAQYDSELITENDSGDALIRLDGAIAAVEDNFAQEQPAPSVPEGWLQHAARMATLARKLREPDWHFESIREMQRELCALEDAALTAASKVEP